LTVHANLHSLIGHQAYVALLLRHYLAAARQGILQTRRRRHPGWYQQWRIINRV